MMVMRSLWFSKLFYDCTFTVKATFRQLIDKTSHDTPKAIG